MQDTKHQVGAVVMQLMHSANIDESTLAKACNISLASLSRIKNNPDSNPTITTLRPIANYFNITIDQLLGFAPINNNVIKHIPVINKLDSFSWIENKTTENPINEWLIYDYEASDTSFAVEFDLNINSNLLNKSLIIVDPNAKFKHDDLIFIYNKRIKEFFLRKISIDDQENKFLKPVEQGFSDYIALEQCKNNITLIGVVIETRLQYGINSGANNKKTNNLSVINGAA